jgi:hypothetical protein
LFNGTRISKGMRKRLAGVILSTSKGAQRPVEQCFDKLSRTRGLFSTTKIGVILSTSKGAQRPVEQCFDKLSRTFKPGVILSPSKGARRPVEQCFDKLSRTFKQGVILSLSKGAREGHLNNASINSARTPKKHATKVNKR